MSLAAAMTLGFKKGRFYRGARLHCINLLLTYPDGCAGRRAYCGLAAGHEGPYRSRSFIRVRWPTCSLEETFERIAERRGRVRRVCISMVTRRRAVGDTVTICRRLTDRFDIPVSILVSPTVLGGGDLRRFREAGTAKSPAIGRSETLLPGPTSETIPFPPPGRTSGGFGTRWDGPRQGAPGRSHRPGPGDRWRKRERPLFEKADSFSVYCPRGRR